VPNSRQVQRPESSWRRRLGEPGWLLLPLRGFLGVTFSYAGLQKLANPSYLNPHSATSAVAQMRLLQHSSPIGPLVALSTHAPSLVGLLIAFGELAVGIGTLLGLYPRIAAAGGALLSLSFFLTVSWNTTPYYYGSDIVFVFAWLTLLGFGTSGVLSLEAWLRNRARGQLRLGPEPAAVRISTDRLRALCPRAGQCGLRPDGSCGRSRGCPVFPTEEALSPGNRAELDRRLVLQTGVAAALAAGGALAIGAATAAIGRAARGTGRRPTANGLIPPTTATPTPATRGPADSPSPSAAGPTAGGTVIGTTSQVPVGQAREFTDPASGQPAWMVHPTGSTFVAFSAVCTHAGCSVQYDSANVQFVCPCHGGVYDARTGQVLQGPPPSPLPSIPVRVTAGQLRVDG
jgi:thiosulfate dehydrogenase (quinone) large subunit